VEGGSNFPRIIFAELMWVECVAKFWSHLNGHFFFLHKLQIVTKKKMLLLSC
jgi:hypothetical protein